MSTQKIELSQKIDSKNLFFTSKNKKDKTKEFNSVSTFLTSFS